MTMQAIKTLDFGCFF